ncbi:23S rRNA (cytidine1920-2'-O)/16S rRNA (cytidine1409-2'-O)-methyltransferase [Gracilibacillus halotolerans]|uniref:23S rRNA (Cytidine1920-2'-O)/16S rRNA (Cytidine1409-2'-O)-methyltransferase n=1 Tax=Gracilibacillus halotolerans TaxID=74386 RepID=A0A841RKM1_9BACI|nr:TlyA family RNA methyltransferase [Gracilibacillus halotolerans]MBB6511745.1 23S rRNA (cytidine1920-2'-O)/16S rRNA (cytidine1409-2'-O)-methyltransferase [Gracilibacillus halotolerans]
MGKKIRVDQLLVNRGLLESREKAKTTIMAGHVFSNGQRIDKPGTKVDEEIPLEVKGNPLPYVGRGGLKLEKALDYFNLDISNRTMVDVGASTGGFTDCALQNGVERSYAIDVGYNQLAWKLRNDSRVVVMERTNFRYMTPDKLEYELPSFAGVDVSFISLKLILPPLYELLTNNSDALILIKPQFEAGKDQVGKKGIVRDRNVHEEVIKEILSFAESVGFQIAGLTYSPITGGDGNIEFLAWLKKSDEKTVDISYQQLIKTVVDEAHDTLIK